MRSALVVAASVSVVSVCRFGFRERIELLAAAPAVGGGSVVNFAPGASAQLSGSLVVSVIENFASSSTTDFCHIAVGAIS